MLLTRKRRSFVAIALACTVAASSMSVTATQATRWTRYGSYDVIWADTGPVAGDPSISRDGRLLATLEPLTSTLWVLDLVTGVRQSYDAVAELSPKGSRVGSIAISPDEVAVIRWDPLEDTSELAVISLDGTSERVLLSAPSDTWLEVFAWTSAGELIVEKRVPTANTVHLLLVSSRDGAQTELWNTSQARYLTAVRESPDANFVAISFFPWRMMIARRGSY